MSSSYDAQSFWNILLHTTLSGHTSLRLCSQTKGGGFAWLGKHQAEVRLSQLPRTTDASYRCSCSSYIFSLCASRCRMPFFFFDSFVPRHSFAGIVPVPAYKGVMPHTCHDYTLTPVNSANPTAVHQVSYHSTTVLYKWSCHDLPVIHITTSATTQQVSVSSSVLHKSLWHI